MYAHIDIKYLKSHYIPLRPSPNSTSAGGTSVSQGYFVSEHAPNEELKKKNEERRLRQ